MMKEKSLDDYIYISLLITTALLILAIIIYKNFLYTIPIGFCYIHEHFGFYCPGCGCTRAFLALLNLDLISSVYYNPSVLYSVIVLVTYIFTQTVDRLLHHKKYIMPYSNFYLFVGISILIINCIVRNILLLYFNLEL